MKTVLTWIALAAIVVVVLVIARDPIRWLGDRSYTPRAVVNGSNQPAAPREDPATEQLAVTALQAAADYAQGQHSRALIVTRHGYFVFERYWQGSDFNTVVDSRGLGRVVAALTAGAAIADRKIAWPDEPLGYLLPDWSKEPRGAITVRNLLQLSSGLAPSYGSSYRDLPLAERPGTRWVDQESDADLLAYTIQQATGLPYADYLSAAIWRRIGAGDASIWVQKAGAAPHADSGFRARQGDWLRVGELLLGNGNYQGDEVLPPRWVPELLKPALTNSHYGSYLHLGAHAEPRMSPYASPDVYVVEGGGNRMWLVPSLQLAILRTGDDIGADWDDGRIPNLIINGAHDFVPAAARPGSDLRQLVPNH